jgi:hypothetical protein
LIAGVEPDGHFGVRIAREVPKLRQYFVRQTDKQIDPYSVGPANSADGSWEEDIGATDC